MEKYRNSKPCLKMFEMKINLFRRYKVFLVSVFSFLVGCMLTINLIPIDKTCRIDESDREYNIMKNSKLKNPELIVVIISAQKNLAKRNTIRETWLRLKDREHSSRNDNVKFKMKHYFVIGSLGLTTDEVLHLTSEQSEFEDMLILPMYDSYNNLTLKVVKTFEWLHEQYDFGLNFKYVLKCDDDSFVRIDNLLHEIEHIEMIYLKSELQQALASVKEPLSPYMRLNAQISNKNDNQNRLQLYWGYFSGTAKVKKTGKWKEDSWIACDNYVPYALGGGYVLSKHLVSFIARNAKDLRYFNSEDISVGLWLSGVDNVLRIHDARFDTEWTSRGCQNPYLIRHNISMEDMHNMYNNIVKTNDMCSVEVITRTFYYYNWLYKEPPTDREMAHFCFYFTNEIWEKSSPASNRSSTIS